MIRIIIVEDDPMVARLNAEYLNNLEDFSVVGQFSNGLDALNYIRTNPVDLAIVATNQPVIARGEVTFPELEEKIVNAIVITDIVFMLISFGDYIMAYFRNDSKFQSIQEPTEDA